MLASILARWLFEVLTAEQTWQLAFIGLLIVQGVKIVGVGLLKLKLPSERTMRLFLFGTSFVVAIVWSHPVLPDFTEPFAFVMAVIALATPITVAAGLAYDYLGKYVFQGLGWVFARVTGDRLNGTHLAPVHPK